MSSAELVSEDGLLLLIMYTNILSILIQSIHIYPERQPNGQILKRIDFKFPITYNEEDIEALCWDKDGHIECVVLMSRV